MERVVLEKVSQKSLSPKLPKDLSGYLVDGKVFNRMSKDWRKRVLKLKIEMNIGTKFTHETWPTKEAYMKVSCNCLRIEFLAARVVHWNRKAQGWSEEMCS
ncbi:hypothetical protein Pint_31767 [Pistacia integerrima]|uniref:Uncharacterized protein n=1 Tax=Pistacia integerrima TaxID=434235 RepID=A0ACC0XR72_9ROSI|nr:hypothetical protein Pint_31767 [Pistacia integerrima]